MCRRARPARIPLGSALILALVLCVLPDVPSAAPVAASAAGIRMAISRPPPAQPDVAAAVGLVLRQANAFRAEQGLAGVEREAQLAATAQAFADFMAAGDRYGHDADGRSPAQRARAGGYDPCAVAENIAYVMNSQGFSTEDLAEAFVEGWKNSPGHRRNMLDPQVVDTGVAIARSPRTQRFYAVQMFGRPHSMAVRFSIENDTGRALRYRLGSDVFMLEPRVTRTHEGCGGSTLRVGAGSGAEAIEVGPVDGHRYTLVREGGDGVRLIDSPAGGAARR